MIHEMIAKVADRKDLTEEEMSRVMEDISEGEVTPAQLGALLVALRMKGECEDEITGAAKVLRSKSIRLPLNEDQHLLVDTCGTGGDKTGTFNVSTTVSFVAAGCGLAVAKHGNRSVSSRCGSADVLEELGVNLDLEPKEVAACIQEVGVGFLFAPLLHPAMKHAVVPRREVGLKSIFNLVGPLTNPAGASVQLVGVFRKDLTETLARVLGRLGGRSAFVVHGLDGCDEISITGPTQVSRLFEDGRVDTHVIEPEQFGMARADMADILGGDASTNAAMTLDVLKGVKGPCRDIVLLNAGAVVVAAGRAKDIAQGAILAAEAIDRGLAMQKLEQLVEVSNRGRQRDQAVGE